ncbi:MAG: ABC transporter permease, partial [Rhodococcus sp. (in: high G+C Gram-positive bacteria)]|nr:ABC transporter permease [Rhodococcus sp. (in: high G+C Gram-positive bacteria)]
MSETVKTGRAVRQSHFVAPPEVAAPGETDAVKLDQAPTSMWTDAWRDLRKRPLFIISTIIILAVIVIAAFPSLFTSTDPRFCDLTYSMQGPTSGHWFGFDRQGCDVYSR